MPGHRIAALLVLIASSVAWADEPAKPSDTPGAVTVDKPGEGTPYRLVYKFTTGQFAHFETSTSTTIVTKFPGGNPQAKNQIQESTTTNASQTWKQFRVVSVDDQGLATLEPIITRVKMSLQFGNLPAVTFDSAEAGPEPLPQFADVAKSIGKAFARVVVAPNGELVKFTLLDGAPAKLAGPAAKADPVLNFLVVLPKEPVGFGAEWKDRFQVPVTLGNGLTQLVTLQRKYTLAKVDGSIATIASRISVMTPINDPLIEAQLMQRATAGAIEFDLDRGLIVNQIASVNQQVVGAAGANTVLQATSEIREKLISGIAGVQPAGLRE